MILVSESMASPPLRDPSFIQRSPWNHIGIDFIGPMSPPSSAGNCYILIISDYFTKWVDAVPLPTKEAPGVVTSLLKVIDA